MPLQAAALPDVPYRTQDYWCCKPATYSPATRVQLSTTFHALLTRAFTRSRRAPYAMRPRVLRGMRRPRQSTSEDSVQGKNAAQDSCDRRPCRRSPTAPAARRQLPTDWTINSSARATPATGAPLRTAPRPIGCATQFGRRSGCCRLRSIPRPRSRSATTYLSPRCSRHFSSSSGTVSP